MQKMSYHAIKLQRWIDQENHKLMKETIQNTHNGSKYKSFQKSILSRAAYD